MMRSTSGAIALVFAALAVLTPKDSEAAAVLEFVTPNRTICPAGEEKITVRLTSHEGIPLTGSAEYLLLIPEADFQACTSDPNWQGYYWGNPHEITDPGSEGIYEFSPKGSWCGDFRVLYDLLPAATDIRGVGNSPDLDLASPPAVTNTDHILFVQRFLTSDPCADFDEDGLVDLGDLILFKQHFLHDCGTAGPATGRGAPMLSPPGPEDEVSWGRLKANYR